MCLQLLLTKLFFMRRFWFCQSATNRYQSIPIYLLIGIDNRYQLITTRIFTIDWSSIININRLIDIDWYRLSSIIDSIDWIPRVSSDAMLAPNICKSETSSSWSWKVEWPSKLDELLKLFRFRLLFFDILDIYYIYWSLLASQASELKIVRPSLAPA